MSSKLPKGWIETSLSICCYITMGQSPPSNTYNFEKKGLPFFQGKAEFGYKYPVVVKYCSDPKRIAQANDILLSVRAPVGPTNRAKELCCIGRGLAAIRSWLDDSQQYVHYYLISKENWFSNQGSGSTFKAIGKEFLHDLPIPLPPLNEQKRIVAKLDAIMPRIEVVKERLDRVPEAIRRFRQSVLNNAVTGKLTEQWREAHPEVGNLENAIKAYCKQRLSKCSSTAQRKKVKAIYDSLESEAFAELPATWEYVFLKKICKTFQYGTSAKSAKQGKVAVLRMGNLQNGKIDWSDLAYTSNEKEIKKYLLKKGDVLFNRTNSPELVGKTSIYMGEHIAIFAGYLIRIGNCRNLLDSHYLNYALNTGYARKFCHREKTDGVNQSNINAQKLAHFEIPLPPLEEQKEIVRQAERLFALADKVEVRYQRAKERVDKLAQSLLAKAFRGELVSQDPNDEPAEKLLKRIEAERGKVKKATSTQDIYDKLEVAEKQIASGDMYDAESSLCRLRKQR